MMALATKRRDPYELMRRGRLFRRMKRNERGHHSYWWRCGQQALWFDPYQPASPIDKSRWGDGPWQHESDRECFEAHGLRCIVGRSATTGALCGYVRLPKGHPWARLDAERIDVDTYGGITFAETIGAYRWLGFDCAHYRDRMPAIEATLRSLSGRHEPQGERYRDLAWVRAETEHLAEQVASHDAHT